MNNDWTQKLAANVRASRPEIEKAFAQQAYSFIAAKAGQLMDDNICLGFELIHGNDDNTRLIGAFIFRLDQIWLAPVFFINGQIKGDQFLWDTKARLFKPLCTEWAEFLFRSAKVRSTEEPGSLMSRAEADRSSGMGNDLGYIARQPHMINKTARYTAKNAIHGTSEELTDTEVFDTFCKVDEYTPGSLLTKTVKTATADMLDGIMEAMSRNDNAAEFMLQLTGGNMDILSEAYVAKKVAEQDSVKTASSDPVRSIRFNCGWLQKTAAADTVNDPVAAATMRNGFEMIDTTTETIPVRIIESDITFSTLTAGHVAEIPVVTDENSATALVADGASICGIDMSSGNGMTSGYCRPLEPAHLHLYFVESKTIRRIDPSTVHGISNTESVETAAETIEKYAVTPKKGDVVCAIQKRGLAMSDYALLITNMEKRSGDTNLVTLCEIYPSGYVGRPMQLLMDQSRKSDWSNGIFGSDTVFLPVATESAPKSDSACCAPAVEGGELFEGKKLKESPVPTSARSVFEMVIRNNGVVVSAAKAADHYKLKVDTGTKTAKWHTFDHPVKFASALCFDVGLSADEAAIMLDRVNSTRFGVDEMRFAVQYDEVEKTAGPMAPVTIIQGFNAKEPNWNPQYDSYNNVLTDWPRSFTAEVSRNVNGSQRLASNEMVESLMNRSSVNGPMRPEQSDVLPAEELMNMSPGDIETAIRDRNLMHASEHGIIGQLVRTYDVGRVISDVLPDIEVGVDRIGRLSFLMFWKPSDFEKLYGSDELLQRETQLTGAFRSIGLLVLDLKKRPQDASGASDGMQ